MSISFARTPPLYRPTARKVSTMTDSLLTCHRPHCNDPATAEIPLPIGCPEGDNIAVCSRHEQEAREACYFVVTIGSPPSEDDFNQRTWAKHRTLRGGSAFKFIPRHAKVRMPRN